MERESAINEMKRKCVVLLFFFFFALLCFPSLFFDWSSSMVFSFFLFRFSPLCFSYGVGGKTYGVVARTDLRHETCAQGLLRIELDRLILGIFLCLWYFYDQDDDNGVGVGFC